MGLIILLIFGAICAAIASGKGRSVVGWFLLGFFFPIIALIVICCVSDLNEEQRYRTGQDRENRMLREKLLQEQMKLESLTKHAAHRLDEHDRLLQANTRDSAPPLMGSSQQPNIRQITNIDDDLADESVWYYAVNDKHCGPLTRKVMIQLIDVGSIQRDTMVWNERWAEWTTAGNTKEFGWHFTV
jgi:hypothetical protein